MSALEIEVSEEFASRLAAKMGYNFSRERVIRIAEDARSIMDELNCGAAFAFGGALDTEIVMYGNPNYNGAEPIGILNVSK